MSKKDIGDALAAAKVYALPEPATKPEAAMRNGHDDGAEAGPDHARATPSAPGDTEDALAREFAARAAPTMRWTPSMGWMHYDGTCWQRDEMLTAFDLARQVCRESAQAHPKQSVRLASAKTRNGVVTLAQADPLIGVQTHHWDRDPLELNTPTGVVDLRTGRIRPRTASDFVTMVTAVGPAGFASCPRFLQFLSEIFPGVDGSGDADMIGFMQRSVGHWLTGDRREQVLWFAHGTGSNGKSVLFDLVLWLMGSYATKLPSASLMQSRGERHSTDLAGLRGKRLAVSSELEEGQHFAESLVKELTGDSVLTARFMRMDFFSYEMQQKHIVVGNTKPRLHGGDPAMARRLLLVPFNAKFAGAQIDRMLLAKLKDEGPAILAWAIRGAGLWLADGLCVPASVRAASAEYLADHDDLRIWMEECCQRTGSERPQPLYDSFATWKKARGELPPSMTRFGTQLAQLEGIAKRNSHGAIYDGIALTTAAKEAAAQAHRQRFPDY